MLKFGYITELDTAKGVVRVHFTDDDIVSNPLPVSVPASKTDKYSFPFAINEQVWCLMDDNCEFGVVGGAIYSAKDKPPSGAGDDHIIIDVNSGKARLTINRQTGDIELTGQGKLKISNAQAGLKDIIQSLKNFIQSIKVNTPAGPSAGLIQPTATELNELQQKLDNLMN